MANTNTNAKKEAVIAFRIDDHLAKAFKEIAQANNRNQSLLLRDYVIDYVKKHRQGNLPL